MKGYLEYLKQAMRRAEYEKIKDGSVYAHIPGFDGLWANAATFEDARDQLYEALDEWVYVNGFVSQLALPPIDGIAIGPPSQTAD